MNEALHREPLFGSTFSSPRRPATLCERHHDNKTKQPRLAIFLHRLTHAWPDAHVTRNGGRVSM